MHPAVNLSTHPTSADGRTSSGDADSTVGTELISDLKWSERIERRYEIRLSSELRHWFDSEVWRHAGHGEYCHAISPDILQQESPGPVWPPLMPPHFLPLIGSDAGDWLCLRLKDPEACRRVDEVTPFDICQWYHGGGDWMPWGDSLSEALLFDWLLPRLPMANRRHAIPAAGAFDEQNDPDPSEVSTANDKPVGRAHVQSLAGENRWCEWAESWLPEPVLQCPFVATELSTVGLRFRSSNLLGNASGDAHDNSSSSLELKAADSIALALRLCELGVCEIPVRCQLVIDALSNDLAPHLSPVVASQLDVSWNELMRWCFDLGQLPPSIVDRLRDEQQVPQSAMDPSQQNWQLVHEHCQRVCELAPELAWGHELLGYVDYRQGDFNSANASFSKAIRCSVFTDQSVRLRTHWATLGDGAAKFSALFMAETFASESESGSSTNHNADSTSTGMDRIGLIPRSFSTSDCLSLFRAGKNAGTTSVRQQVAERMCDLAQQHLETNPAEAIRYLHAAGWDLGAEPMTNYAMLLDQLVQACAQSQWTSHQRLAETHRQCLRSRYSI